MTEKKKQNGLKGTRICLEGESRRRSFKMLSSLKVSTAILAVVIAVVFYACNKETIQDNLLSPKKAEIKSELQELYDQMPHVDYGNIKVVHDDILQFESEEHYEKVIKQLTQRYEEWSTMFLDKYDVKVTEDELDSIQDALGFSDYMPMIKFEEEFGIYGKNLRYMQRNIEDDWLDKGAVGLPLTDKMIIDPAEQTLLNKYREVCIGDIIHQVREDCSVLIPLKYASALSNIRSMSTEALTKDGRVKVLKIAGGCYEPEWYKSKYQEHPVNSKKFKWEYSFHYSSIISCYRSIEKMTNYTKNKKGKWRNGWAVCACLKEQPTPACMYYYDSANDKCVYWSAINPAAYTMQTPINLMCRVKSYNYKYHDLDVPLSSFRIDPANSIAFYRHNGWTFSYNVQTGNPF